MSVRVASRNVGGRGRVSRMRPRLRSGHLPTLNGGACRPDAAMVRSKIGPNAARS
jgi:hypothetical protein